MIISRSIHVAVNGIISFFFTAEQYSIVYMYHIFSYLFTCHLSCFHVLVIINIDAVNIRVKVQLFVIKPQPEKGREDTNPFLI